MATKKAPLRTPLLAGRSIGRTRSGALGMSASRPAASPRTRPEDRARHREGAAAFDYAKASGGPRRARVRGLRGPLHAAGARAAPVRGRAVAASVPRRRVVSRLCPRRPGLARRGARGGPRGANAFSRFRDRHRGRRLHRAPRAPIGRAPRADSARAAPAAGVAVIVMFCFLGTSLAPPAVFSGTSLRRRPIELHTATTTITTTALGPARAPVSFELGAGWPTNRVAPGARKKTLAGTR